MICNDKGKPVRVKPSGADSAHSSSRLTKRVKCAGVVVWSTDSTGIGGVWVVGVNSASTRSNAARKARFIASRSASAAR